MARPDAGPLGIPGLAQNRWTAGRCGPIRGRGGPSFCCIDRNPSRGTPGTLREHVDLLVRRHQGNDVVDAVLNGQVDVLEKDTCRAGSPGAAVRASRAPLSRSRGLPERLGPPADPPVAAGLTSAARPIASGWGADRSGFCAPDGPASSGASKKQMPANKQSSFFMGTSLPKMWSKAIRSNAKVNKIDLNFLFGVR